MPIDRAAFDRNLDQLRLYARQLVGVIDDTLPPGLDPAGISCHSCEHPLKGVADSVDNVLTLFDELQISLGEDAEYTRHRRLIGARCRG
jgi:hypothetical protein